jgi:hypothetical protein
MQRNNLLKAVYIGLSCLWLVGCRPVVEPPATPWVTLTAEPTATPENFNGPLPPFLGGILMLPPPGLRLVMHAPDSGHVSMLVHGHPAQLEAADIGWMSICFSLNLAEMYDFNEEGVDTGYIFLHIDDVKARPHPEAHRTLLELEQLDPETGVSIGRKPAGQLSSCGLAATGPGHHSALLEFVKGTGENFQYSWSFELIEP